MISRFAAGLLVVAACVSVHAQPAPRPADPDLARLADEFDGWLAANAPVTPFASDRLQRPPGWEPDWSRTALQRRKVDYLQLQGRLKAVDTLGFDVADRIDAAILGARVERVHWMLEVLATPRRDPGFYVDQSLGSVFDILVGAPEPSEAEVEEVILRLQRFTGVINAAKLNLDRTVRVLADAALARMGDTEARIDALESALASHVPGRLRADFALGLRAARQSLNSYRDWLGVSLERFQEPPAIGVQRYRWYLGHVALVPRSPELLLAESELAQARIGARLAAARHRLGERPSGNGLESVARVVQMADIVGPEVVTFLESAALVTMSDTMAQFRMATLPATLQPLAGIFEPIDLARSHDSPTVRFLRPQRSEAGFLEYTAWVDPRLLLTRDGVPGRHALFVSAACNDRPIRRQAIGPYLSQGLAMYLHEQVADAGLYAFSPESGQLALQWLRYRAALAELDIRLADGSLAVAKAVDALVERTGVDRAQAARAVQALVAYPGVAGAAFAAYGQVIRFLSDAAIHDDGDGGTFSLTDFNTRLAREAHVPVALQRWEALGVEDELDQLVEQRGRPATVPE